jgi:hypothetical protein
MAFRTVVASAALVVVLAATGCSGGGGAKVATLANGADSSSSSGTGTKQSFQDAMVSYTGCMREHGVDLPDPTFADGSGNGGFAIDTGSASGGASVPKPDDASFRAADEACKPILDEAIKDMPKPSPEEQAKARDQALAFAKCMREHGVDMPDPTFDDTGATSIQIAGGPPDNGSQKTGGPDAAFVEAAKACQTDGGPAGFNASPGGGVVIAGGTVSS